jgi:hypothetical protein
MILLGGLLVSTKIPHNHSSRANHGDGNLPPKMPFHFPLNSVLSSIDILTPNPTPSFDRRPRAPQKTDVLLAYKKREEGGFGGT